MQKGKNAQRSIRFSGFKTLARTTLLLVGIALFVIFGIKIASAASGRKVPVDKSDFYSATNGSRPVAHLMSQNPAVLATTNPSRTTVTNTQAKSTTNSRHSWPGQSSADSSSSQSSNDKKSHVSQPSAPTSSSQQSSRQLVNQLKSSPRIGTQNVQQDVNSVVDNWMSLAHHTLKTL